MSGSTLHDFYVSNNGKTLHEFITSLALEKQDQCNKSLQLTQEQKRKDE